jgi:hypothetical protein
MKLSWIQKWLPYRWRQHDPQTIKSYAVAFSGEHGERVLHHLIDNVYSTVYEGTDPVALAFHNGRRSVIHEILVNMDYARYPEKYAPPEISPEEILHGYGLV